MWIALRFTLLTMTWFGLVYPLFITGVGQVLFPHQANGSLIQVSAGRLIGSELVGQNFSKPEYFHPRPSFNRYDGTNSSGSNWGATNHQLIERVSASALAYQQENGTGGFVPVDAVTASGSGLDPHISLANALAQIPRVAKTRRQDERRIRQSVMELAEQPLLSQTPYVNVLKLNLALDSGK
jgi:K+-transporting ATPase ATPase C chain